MASTVKLGNGQEFVSKSDYDKLAVECVNIKASREILAKNALETCNVVFSAGFRNSSLERGLMASTVDRNTYPNPIKALVDEAEKEYQTPASAAAIAELKAQGVDELAITLWNRANEMVCDGVKRSIILEVRGAAKLAEEFAAQLRAGKKG